MTSTEAGGDGMTAGTAGTAMEELVAAIHATDTRAVLAVTGGGVTALSWLLGVPGASRTVLEAIVPYAATALAQLIGQRPDQAVSADTAARMADACLRRAVDLTGMAHSETSAARPTRPFLGGESTSIRPYAVPSAAADADSEGTAAGGDGGAAGLLIGVAATAALVSDRPKRGDHRAHVGLAWRDGSAFGQPGPGQAVWSLQLAKGARDRNGEDSLVSALVIAVVAHGSGVRPDSSSSWPRARPLLLAEDVIEPAWPG